jgi:uncharacterized membrane protein YqhA
VGVNKLFLFRYLCILPIVSSLLGSILMFFIGALKTVKAFSALLMGYAVPESNDLSPTYETAVLLIRSVDCFLIGLFLIIFAYSVYALFLKGVAVDQEAGPFAWLKMDGLDQLKTALAQLVVVILFVLCLDKLMASEKGNLGYEQLVLPIAILCLAAAKRLLRRQ